MSNQGNILVWVPISVNEKHGLLYTTSRWSGPQTPIIVQDVIRDGFNWLSPSEEGATPRVGDLLSHLIKHESVYLPIVKLGNTDTPTVHIDENQVTWFREHDMKTLGTWTFSQYALLNLKNLPLYNEHYE